MAEGDGGPLAGGVDAGIGFEVGDRVFDVADVEAGVDTYPVAFGEEPVGAIGIDAEEVPGGGERAKVATAEREGLVAGDHGGEFADFWGAVGGGVGIATDFMDEAHFPFAIGVAEGEVDVALDDGVVVDGETVDSGGEGREGGKGEQGEAGDGTQERKDAERGEHAACASI